MRKVNLERKIEFALVEALEALKMIDKREPVYLDVAQFRISQCISYLCMIDDYVVEEKTTYYCLSEIERNYINYVEERKRKANENGNK